ncbi:SPOC domain-containing protein [Colletotrichum karsti]|uniref:Transcription factor BYE1 n=1 Tax=Colletotrichum karsti TaxID=1095194 RepID=A0A9P6IIW5_9PEZI|nr:SPOC domain-containing protein [Colletotrichum karsti]KAF9880540.1 SPOC domain-containing protein [Colletotrichum karsti]
MVRAEPEPRRSVRATKGQHTKAFDDQPIEPPKKRGRKKKQEEEPEDEIIRCVCGATEQDGDSEEPWIACDKCGAWQHNVCMGMSVFSEDLPKNYYCEQCAPQDHKELLSAMAKGELPWEARRKAYEDEQAEKKKKKKKGGRVGKRASDPREDLSQDARSSKAEDSPAPSETNQKKDKKDSGAKATTGKRKVRDEEKETKIPAPKIRKVAEPEAPIVEYTAPADLTAKVADLPDDRKGSAQLLQKALSAILTAAVKDKSVTLPKDTTVAAKAERLALEIERAVHDTHPDRSHYAAQARALYANMKINADLTKRLVKRTLSPPMLATMTADELATKERQDANAQLKAISEKQSILITDEGPRVRRTHKGEEIVENDSFQQSDEARSFIRRPSGREGGADKTDGEQRYDNSVELPAHGGLQIDTQGARQSPKHPDFDINKVFAKTPTGSHTRRPSAPLHGPGVDPDVDRLLQDETDSPPYSPTDETDPDVVWRGHLVMSSIADFPAAAKYVAGANLSRAINLPWTSLIPKKLTVAGRIDEQKAIEYLCGLRYADLTDIVVVALSPASDTFRQEFQTLFEYFVNKKRYAVIGDKGLGNVRDTYLVPVPAGEGNVPEFLLNLADNFVPQKRTEPMLLAQLTLERHSHLPVPPTHLAVYFVHTIELHCHWLAVLEARSVQSSQVQFDDDELLLFSHTLSELPTGRR